MDFSLRERSSGIPSSFYFIAIDEATKAMVRRLDNLKSNDVPERRTTYRCLGDLHVLRISWSSRPATAT
jgi:hypothetical protein